MPVAAEDRFTKASPCPICGGNPADPRGQEKRCTGYHMDGGEAVICTRIESPTAVNTVAGPGWVHRLNGSRPVEKPKTEKKKWESSRQFADFTASYLNLPFVAEWEYRSADGVPVAKVLRFGPNKQTKQYRPICAAPGGWYSGDPQGKWPLYRLDKLHADETLFVAEGEKCADALAALELDGTTSAHGANAPAKTDWSPVKGREVVIFPDNDKAGEDYAQAVATLCHAAGARRITVCKIDGIEPSEDVADWIDKRGDFSDSNRVALLEIVMQTPAWKPPPKPLQSLFAAEGRGENQTPKLPWSWLDMTKMLKAGCVAVVGGPAGYGKTLMSMQIALNLSDQGVAWKYLPLEDSKMDFERRVLAYLDNSWDVLDDAPETADRRLRIYELHAEKLWKNMKHVEENPRLVMAHAANGDLSKLPRVNTKWVLDWCRENLKTHRVLFIDPLAQIDMEGSKQWVEEQRFIQAITLIAEYHKGTIVINAHTVKRSGQNAQLPLSAEDLQGSAAMNRLVHTILLLNAHNAKESEVNAHQGHITSVHTRTITVGKARNGPGTHAKFAANLNAPAITIEGVII